MIARCRVLGGAVLTVEGESPYSPAGVTIEGGSPAFAETFAEWIDGRVGVGGTMVSAESCSPLDLWCVMTQPAAEAWRVEWLDTPTVPTEPSPLGVIP